MYVPAVVIFVRIFGRQADLSKYDKVCERALRGVLRKLTR